MNRRYYKVLTIAGSDSGGGAGIQADLKTFSALGCYGMSVITALTAQNTLGVSGIHAIPPAFVAQQIDAIFSDMGADAVKIGMLYSAELIRTIADQLKKYRVEKIVLDPVMVAQSGDKLLQDDAIDAIRNYLMPICTVVTPNLPEASVLLGQEIHGREDMKAAAKSLSDYGCQSVLIKGGHSEDHDSTDVLYMTREDRYVILSKPRVQTRNNHGTGCTLSSAIASFLAKSFPVEDALRHAKEFIHRAIVAGAEYSLGKGHGPVHHFFEFCTAFTAPI